MITSLFLFTLFLLFHPYLFYPISLVILAGVSFRKSPVSPIPAQSQPMVSVVISAFNEEKVIGPRVENLLAQDYPQGKLEILVGSDGSSDRTDAIMATVQSPSVRFFSFGRQGKAATINRLAQQARGEILLFSDANTEFRLDAVTRIVEGFANASTGAVCGRLVMVSPGSHGEKGEGFYWKFETWLKRLETRLGVVQGGNGAIYAVRKELFRPLSGNTINDDFTISMNVYRAGKKMIYQDTAIAYEETAKTLGSELRRHIRDASGHFIALWELRFLFNPGIGLPFYAFVSHRVLRWLFPGFMILAVILNCMLTSIPLFQVIGILQATFYGVALLGGFWWVAFRKTTPAFPLFYFVAINICLILGLWRVISGRAKPMWNSTER